MPYFRVVFEDGPLILNLMLMKKYQGFTLVELLISVGIVGIIASIAYPSYQDSVLKSHRTDAKAALVNLVNVMERGFTESNDYTVVPDPADTPYYVISIVATPNTYILSATPIVGSSQEHDACGNLTINNFGQKNAGAAGCW